jgi:hypothetical protein
MQLLIIPTLSTMATLEGTQTSLQDFLSVMLGLSFFLFAAAAVITLFGNRSTGISLERLNK